MMSDERAWGGTAAESQLYPRIVCSHPLQLLDTQFCRLETIWNACWFGSPLHSATSDGDSTPAFIPNDALPMYSGPSIDGQSSLELDIHLEPFDRRSALSHHSMAASCSTAINVGGRSPNAPARGGKRGAAITPPHLHLAAQDANGHLHRKSAAGSPLPPLQVPSLQQGPGMLGTWADRQYRLLSSDDEDFSMAGPSGRPAGGRPPHTRLATHRSRPTSTEGSPENEAAAAAAAAAASNSARGSTHSDAPAGAAGSATVSNRTSRDGEDGGAPSTRSQNGTSSASSSAATQRAAADSGGTASTTDMMPANGALPSERTISAPQSMMSRFAAAAAAKKDSEGPPRELGEDEAMQAAWRWRFTRRWHAEQARGVEDDSGHGGDDADEALQYLVACGAGGRSGWNICRDESLGPSGVLNDAIQQIDNSPCLERLLAKSESLAGIEVTLGEDSPTRDRRADRIGDLTSPQPAPAAEEVRSMRRAAHDILQQQQQVEKMAEQRWRECMGGADEAQWVGSELQRVEVDKAGSFQMFVIRLKDHLGHQKIIVRGQNQCNQAAIVKKVVGQMSTAARKLRMPAGTVQVMGGGVLEWRRDHTTHVQIHTGFICDADGCNKGITRTDLLSLASVLIKHSLPPQYRVTVGAV